MPGVGPVQRMFTRWGALHDNGSDRLTQQQVVVDVGGRDHHRQRAAVRLDQEAALAAVFPAIRRVFADLVSPEPGFAQGPVGALPLPIDPVQVVALGHQSRPDPVHHTVATPALEPPVNGGIIAELLWQAVPLAPRPEAINEGVEDPPPVSGRTSAAGTGSPIRVEDRFDPTPQVIGDFPNRV
jgi:hypothetical protein